MSYAKRHLIADEQVEYETKLHWIVMLGHVVMAALFAVAGIAVLVMPWHTVNGAEAYTAQLKYAGFAGLAIAVIIF